MALKKMDYDGEVSLLDSKDLAKFREYVNRFGLHDEVTKLLQKSKYREHAAIFFKEFSYTLPEQQEEELAKTGREDFVIAYFSSVRMCAAAVVHMVERKSERLIASYKEIYGEQALDSFFKVNAI